MTSGSSTVKTDGNLSFGGWAAFGIPLGSSFQVHTGVSYLMRSFGTSGSALSLSSIQAPVTLRFVSGVFGLGAGVYADYGLGDVSRSGNGTDLSMTYADAGFKKFGLGVGGSVSGSFPISGVTGFYVEGRYIHDLLNRSAANGVTTKFTDIQLLVGLRFGRSSRF